MAGGIIEQHIRDTLHRAVHAVYASGVQGDICEWGTGSGWSAMSLASAMHTAEQAYFRQLESEGAGPKKLHLFDSFCGLPPIEHQLDKECVHVLSGVWHAGLCQGESADDLVKACCTQFRDRLPLVRVVPHAGWFEDTMRHFVAPLVALAHIDCDLYLSSKQALEPLFGRRQLTQGAWVLFDDWSANRASRDHGQRKLWRELCDEYSITHEDQGGYGLGARAFIIHHYHNIPTPLVSPIRAPRVV